jgi:hypothetical protein
MKWNGIAKERQNTMIPAKKITPPNSGNSKAAAKRPWLAPSRPSAMRKMMTLTLFSLNSFVAGRPRGLPLVLA